MYNKLECNRNVSISFQSQFNDTETAILMRVCFYQSISQLLNYQVIWIIKFNRSNLLVKFLF